MTTSEPATPGPPPVTPLPSAASGSEDSDWTDQVADLVIDQVDKIRDRTTGTILQVARAVVYGVVALFVLVLVLLVTLAFLGRAIDLIPVEMWISYTVLGVIGVVSGMLLWSKRVPS